MSNIEQETAPVEKFSLIDQVNDLLKERHDPESVRLGLSSMKDAVNTSKDPQAMDELVRRLYFKTEYFSAESLDIVEATLLEELIGEESLLYGDEKSAENCIVGISSDTRSSTFHQKKAIVDKILSRIGCEEGRREKFIGKVTSLWLGPEEATWSLEASCAPEILEMFMMSPSSYCKVPFLAEIQEKILEEYDTFAFGARFVNDKREWRRRFLLNTDLGRVLSDMIDGAKNLKEGENVSQASRDRYFELYEELEKRGLVVVTDFKSI